MSVLVTGGAGFLGSHLCDRVHALRGEEITSNGDGAQTSSFCYVDDLIEALVRGLVLTFVIGCLFNSLLIDHTERLFLVWMAALAFADVGAGGEGEVR